MRAAFSLRLLTEFSLMYGACAGVILRRDAELQGTPGAETQGVSGTSQPHGLLIHLLQKLLWNEQLALLDPTRPEEGGHQTRVLDRATHFLLAMCVRSGEGRRRIMGELARILRESASTPSGIVKVRGPDQCREINGGD